MRERRSQIGVCVTLHLLGFREPPCFIQRSPPLRAARSPHAHLKVIILPFTPEGNPLDDTPSVFPYLSQHEIYAYFQAI